DPRGLPGGARGGAGGPREAGGAAVPGAAQDGCVGVRALTCAGPPAAHARPGAGRMRPALLGPEPGDLGDHVRAVNRELLLGVAQRRVARRSERHLLAPVALDLRGAAVVALAIELDRDPLRAPECV